MWRRVPVRLEPRTCFARTSRRAPFIQGLCTANDALLELTRLHGPNLRRFDVTFARPVYKTYELDALIRLAARHEIANG